MYRQYLKHKGLIIHVSLLKHDLVLGRNNEGRNEGHSLGTNKTTFVFVGRLPSVRKESRIYKQSRLCR